VISSSRWSGFIVAAVASALACVLAVAVGPSFSNNDKGDPGAPAVVEETSTEAPEDGAVAAAEEAVAESDVAEAADTKAAPPNSNGNSDDKAAEGIDKHGFDPDPPGQNTPPATTGPTACEDYDQGSGPYDHDNCDGTQGQHGNGGNGKCAGCTGKADDKSPGGQYPGDHNNGYECDHNGGVGKGNPAHSKCPTQTPPCVDDPNTAADECNPPPPCVDNPNTPVDECDPPPPCVDNPNTPVDDCDPPPPCVDNPNTPVDDCDPPPPCVDNPSTPMDECDPTEACPPGTDMAGEPIPPGGIDECDDDVLGDTIGDVGGDKDDEVLGNREPKDRPPGAVMPFTGTSVLAYVLVALQMIGAGALMARSRKRR
jgi:hypothetical protein